MQFDLPLDELRRYRPPVEEPDDFEDYWARTLDVEARRPLDVEARPPKASSRRSRCSTSASVAMAERASPDGCSCPVTLPRRLRSSSSSSATEAAAAGRPSG